MVSRLIKDAIFEVSGRCMRIKPIAWCVRGYFQRRVNIIFYHGIWRKDQPELDLFTGMDVDLFRSEMEALSKFFRFVNINEILSGIDTADPRPVVCLTFDDGFDLIGSGAADVMDDLGISATVFVNSACVDNTHLMWQHLFHSIRSTRGNELFARKLNGLREKTGVGELIEDASSQILVTRQWPNGRKDEFAAALWGACDMPPVGEFLQQHKPYMSYDLLRQWIERGHVVGFHTHSHPFCSQLTREEMITELVDPVEPLCQRLNLTSIPFAYPFGNRLTPELESELTQMKVFSCLLGTDGFSLHGTDPNQLERTEAEAGIGTTVFGRPVLRAMKSRGR
jgi:peptidoglycan/xylan/chitin deacetylase (PgdA/CDA1 family)